MGRHTRNGTTRVDERRRRRPGRVADFGRVIYGRWCDECGYAEYGFDPELVRRYRRCPGCGL